MLPQWINMISLVYIWILMVNFLLILEINIHLKKLWYLRHFESSREIMRAFPLRKGISPSMICRWKQNEDKLKTNPKNAIRKGNFSFLFSLWSGRKPDFCEIEDETFSELLDACADGKAINYRWIRQTAQSIMRKKYPASDVPEFST